MSNIFHSPPLELSREVVGHTVKNGGVTDTIREILSRRVNIDYIPPEIEASQRTLKKFQGKFGIVSLLDDAPEDITEARISWTAYSMLDEGFVDQDTVVEVRSLLPFESFEDPALNQKRHGTVRKLGDLLTREYGVTALPNPHPILPKEEEGVSVSSVWKAISEELDGFDHQMRGDDRKLAMIAITGTDYARSIFSGEIAFPEDRLASNDILALRHVGSHPRENLLLEPQDSGILDVRQMAKPAASENLLTVK
jgi:hypothetical protein